MKALFLALVTATSLVATQALEPRDIEVLLGESNPFIKDLFAVADASEHEVTYAEGAFDTRLTSSYHKKDYPATQGEFSEVALKQTFVNGMSLEGGWRQALETQEYNNIKTGDNGEVRIGVHFDALGLILGMNKEKFALENAALNYEKENLSAQRKQQILELQVLGVYYQLRYYKAQIGLLENLLHRIKLREEFVLKRIEAGTLAPLAQVELEQQTIRTQQRLLAVQTSFKNSLALFLQYLDLQESEFSQKYHVEPLVYEDNNVSMDREMLLQRALLQRSDYLALQKQEEQLALQNDLAQTLKYPTFKIGAYGTHDLKYEDEGYKVTFDLNFPLQQSQYEGKSRVVTAQQQALQVRSDILLHGMKREITHAMNRLDMLKQTIALAQQEVTLAKRLEEAEERRFQTGISDLFLLAQREASRLEVEQKLLDYMMQESILKLELKVAVADSLFE